MCTGAEIAVASLAISAVSTVSSIGMGIYSAQQQAAQAQAQMNLQAQQAQRQQEMQRDSMILSMQQDRERRMTQQNQEAARVALQVQQTNNSILDRYKEQQRQVREERKQLMSKYEMDRQIAQKSYEDYTEQVRLNNEAANRGYMQEQTKLGEARQKAAFEAQAALAKSIGSKGRVLAAGRSGQSVGLLVNDVERQKGFAQAQADATAQSTYDLTMANMEGVYTQGQSSNNQAYSQIAYNPSTPYLPEMPDAPSFTKLEIPDYDYSKDYSPIGI